jgi:site-specific recombinase XerD
MHLDDALTEFAYSKDHSPESRRWYRTRLGAFTTWAKDQGVTEIEAVDAPLVRRYIEHRRTTPIKGGTLIDSHTLHGYTRAIRTLLNWAASEDLLDARVAKRVALPKKTVKVLPVLTAQQVERMFDACESPRDKSIMAVLLDTGIRASELCGLPLDRVHFSIDDPYLLIYGKGRKQREVGLGKRSRGLLHKWVHRHRVAPKEVQAVFVGRTQQQLRPEGLDRMLYRLRDRAGLQGVRVGAHVWRHTYAYNYVAAGGDVFRLSRLLGHSSVAVTQLYLSAFTARDARRGLSVLDQM